MPDRDESRELLDVLDRIERMFSNLDQGVARLRETVDRSISGLEQSITHLVRSIEQEDRLRDRADRAEARERDELRQLIADDLIPRIENLAKNLRGLPAAIVEHNERKIYEIHPALLSEAELLRQGRLPHRESTGQQVAVARRDVEEHTGVFDTKHTDGEKRAVKEFVGGIALHLWHRGGKWAAAGGGGIGVYHAIKALFEFLRHL